MAGRAVDSVVGGTSIGDVVDSVAGSLAVDGSLKSENPKTHKPVQIKAIAIRCVLGKSKDISLPFSVFAPLSLYGPVNAFFQEVSYVLQRVAPNL